MNYLQVLVEIQRIHKVSRYKSDDEIEVIVNKVRANMTKKGLSETIINQKVEAIKSRNQLQKEKAQGLVDKLMNNVEREINDKYHHISDEELEANVQKTIKHLKATLVEFGLEDLIEPTPTSKSETVTIDGDVAFPEDLKNKIAGSVHKIV